MSMGDLNGAQPTDSSRKFSSSASPKIEVHNESCSPSIIHPQPLCFIISRRFCLMFFSFIFRKLLISGKKEKLYSCVNLLVKVNYSFSLVFFTLVTLTARIGTEVQEGKARQW